jgi:hypothetical protein
MAMFLAGLVFMNTVMTPLPAASSAPQDPILESRESS